MKRVAAALLIGGLLAGGAVAADTSSPEWLSQPSGDDMAKYYPDEALDRSVSGRAVLSCVNRVDTRLEGCQVVEEYPVGMGFGAAAIRMAEAEFRIRPGTENGKPTEGTIRVPIHWAAPMSGARAVIFKAIWVQAPSFADVEAAWPKEAGDLPEGRAVLRCRVRSDGSLINCGIAGQTPKGSPFGAAARTLVDKFRVRLTTEEADTLERADLAISFHFYNPATPQGRARKVVSPEWIQQVDPYKVVALFPPIAADKGVNEGVGVADCFVAPDGQLTDCKVARASPEGLGFGESAVVVAGVTRMNPWTADGRPSHGVRIKLPIAFNLAPEPEAPAN